jgi:hypothetical protein
MFRFLPYFARLRYFAAIVACYGGFGTAVVLACQDEFGAAWRSFLIGCAGFGVNVSPGADGRRPGDPSVTGEYPYIGTSGGS